jgi:hypothetical protein
MKILTLCTYPIKNPKHGGQLRVRNIVDTYRAEGHSVEVVGVLGSENYESEDGFLPFPGRNELSRIIPNPFLMEDYALGQLCATDDSVFLRLSGLIQKSPDVIHVEHPWLFAFALRCRDERFPSARLVYSSHNVEWMLKKEILVSYQGDDAAQIGVALIEAVEVNAVRGADAIVCVSEGDVNWTRTQTATPIVLAPNGVKPWQLTEDGRKESVTITNGYMYALYCASAHPPNMTGFFDMFGGGFGSLKPDEKLVVAGGAGPAIAGDVRVHQSANLAERIVVAGLVSQPCLEGLLDGAHCIVLPLTQGGGTNLKTAEALWSGKHMVATTVAMRGFERFIGAHGVFLADDPITFKRTLRQVMGLPPLTLSPEDVETRRTVLWESCLKPLSGLLASLASEARV